MTELHDTAIPRRHSIRVKRLLLERCSKIGVKRSVTGLPEGGMSASANERLVRRAIEAIWNRGDLDVADELFAASYVNHRWRDRRSRPRVRGDQDQRRTAPPGISRPSRHA